MLPLTITGIALISAFFLYSTLPFEVFKIENGKKILTKAGIRTFIGLFILVILPLIQYFLQEKESEKSEQRIITNLTISYQKSVKEIQSNSDKNYSKTIKVLEVNLGKYKLALDTAKNTIVELIDSIPKSSLPAPILKITDEEGHHGINLLKKDSLRYSYSVTVMSLDESSCCFNLTYNIVTFNKGNYFFDGKTFAVPFGKAQTINKDGMGVFYFDTEGEFEMLYLRLKGSFKDASTNKLYHVDEVYFNNPKSNTSGSMGGKTYKEVMRKIYSGGDK